MEKLQIINHPKFGALTVMVIDGKEMFKANECAAMLGYAHPKDAISRHCKGATFHRLPTSSGMQDVKFIPEGDLWRLIIRSKLPQAEEIEKWIMEEVLPTIRKTGSYSVAEAPQGKQLRLDEKPYEYYDKTWNGEPVLTTEDFAQLTGLDRSFVSRCLQKPDFIEGTDYYFLKGNLLEQFKCAHSKLHKNVNHLYLITKTGFQKLCTYAGLKLDEPKCFIEQKEKPKRFIDPDWETKTYKNSPLLYAVCKLMTELGITDYEVSREIADKLGYRGSSITGQSILVKNIGSGELKQYTDSDSGEFEKSLILLKNIGGVIFGQFRKSKDGVPLSRNDYEEDSRIFAASFLAQYFFQTMFNK